MRNTAHLAPGVAGTTPHPLGLSFPYAEGVFLYDEHGERWLDLIAGVGVNNLGHRPPEVIKAIQEQTGHYLHEMVYGEFRQSPQSRLATHLASLLPDPLDTTYFVNSGTEANEAALKLAKGYTGRSGVIAFEGAYHGSTHGALSVSWGEQRKRPFRPLLPDVRFLPFNDPSELDHITSRTAAVIIEPVQGDAGVRIPDPAFLKALRKRCSETGALLIFDEVQTGFGRTGPTFALEHSGVVPDVITTGKALGGGMPLGALTASADLMSTFSEKWPLGHITTFGGHPVSCAAAVAAVESLIEKKLPATVEAKGRKFRESLDHSRIKEVRQQGLMLAVNLESPEAVQQVVQHCLEEKVLLFWFLSAPSSFRIAPPLIIEDEQIKEGCAVILRALDQL